ncbi:hypothetical protein [Blastococcus sp. SYSU DS0973]
MTIPGPADLSTRRAPEKDGKSARPVDRTLLDVSWVRRASRRCQYTKFPTVVRRSAAMRDSSSTAVRVWVSACLVESAAVETPEMSSAICVDPPAAGVATQPFL